MDMYARIIVLLWISLVDGFRTHGKSICPQTFVCICISSRKYDPYGPEEALVDCSSMSLITVPPFRDFEGIVIKEILFNNNKIKHINARAFAGLNISLISFSNNPLSHIAPNSFEGIHGLTTLMFGGCSLSDFPNIFRYTPEIVDLSIDRNNITYISPGTFQPLKKLHFLDLSRNPVLFHDHIFGGLEESLRDLKLNGMGLKYIPVNAIKRLKHIDNLELQDNLFTKLTKDTFNGLPKNRFTHYIFDRNGIRHIDPDAFRDHPTPIYLDLHGNKLKRLDFIEEPCHFQSSVIHLHGNPIHCDCRIYNLTKYQQITLHGDCATPTKYRKLPIAHEPELHGKHGSRRSFASFAAAECGDPHPEERIRCPCHHEEPIELLDEHDKQHMHQMSCNNYVLVEANEQSLNRAGNNYVFSMAAVLVLLASMLATTS
ncbi:uncharacterized protein LOC141909260 [Tubulanus polymorphus]|uniref:uncharacterized protein LOC141909260 n=1 Tax=Tubulanus polymorphus TaxID=672921 RepID=UPI003DA403B1